MSRGYDVLQVFGNVPGLLGLELELRNGAWEGRYYINGKRHSYKRDKLKVRIWNGDIWLHEQGGESMSLATWLVRFGGAADYKSAYRMIEGREVVSHDFVGRYLSGAASAPRGQYVPADEYSAHKLYDLASCPLFRWMGGLFGSARAEGVWRLYGATTDASGLAVWWYIDTEGRVCYDKRMRYREDGHRDKTFGGTRKYRVGDGFTERPMFGAHLLGENAPNLPLFVAAGGVSPLGWDNLPPRVFDALRTQKINIVESEKTALLATAAFGGVWLATGGKSGIRDVDASMVLFPDIDASGEWSTRGEVCEWWLDAEEMGVELGETSDLGDMIVSLTNNIKR